MIDAIATYIGYALMLSASIALVGFSFALACDYTWRRISRDVPSLVYVQQAVAHYKKIRPPWKWVRDHESDF